MHPLLKDIQKGSYRSLARAISLVENKAAGYMDILLDLPESSSAVIGVTGPPGAGKSTLVDGLIAEMVTENKKVGVVCVDPSSPFHFGALLGDRIRMNRWYNHADVYIRSLASRGSLGGLHPSIIEITDVMKAFGFDYIIIETVGVGQSEVEIAGLADTTIIVLVPESGDEVQTMKAGLMETGDIFVVNKADRPDADVFVSNLKQILQPAAADNAYQIPVIKTVASAQKGTELLLEKINLHQQLQKTPERQLYMLAEKAYYLIQAKKMSGIDKEDLVKKITSRVSGEKKFNLYRFVDEIK